MTVPFDPAGRFTLQLDADAIDLNRYMTVAGEEGGAVEAAPPMEIPADLIRPLNANGKLGIGSVRIGNLELTSVKVGLDAANGRLRINPISAGLFGGSYSGDIRIDVSGNAPTLSMNERVQGVDVSGT